MTVNPGFAGQKCISFVDEKIYTLVRQKEAHGYRIVIDGACSPEKISTLGARGADGFVLGTSALFGKEKTYSQIMASIRESVPACSVESVRCCEKGVIHMKIAMGNDHVALALKREIKAYLENKGHEVLDLGTHTEEHCDYPVYGEAVANAVISGKADCGIVICGTGVGISLAANKVRGIRAVVCSEPYSAMLSKQHNNTNILAFGARVVGTELAKMIVDAWLGAEFEGGRHQRRINLITDIENRNRL